MKVGVNVAVNSETGDIGAFAKKAEDLGFQSLWMAEHPIIPVHTTSKYGGTPDGSIPPSMSDMADPFISLAIASATTSKIMLGTSICLIPEHNPLVQVELSGGISDSTCGGTPGSMILGDSDPFFEL